ncbi:MAG TPA: bifunctional phosphoglucose/phosphomannose isomerase [Candidatus Krumholzibacteria bacterium]|nr:bifunctional phosphoglucose/phosphomannose isomerase [Candidatus Krumholzibacteria bacterium]
MSPSSKMPGEPMLELVGTLPRQIAQSEQIFEQAEIPRSLARKRIIVCGMGGSAAAGMLAQGLLLDAPVLLALNRAYRLPAWVDEDTLIIFSSYSGNTEEVLSCWASAEKIFPSAPKLVISSGGSLVEKAKSAEVPCLILPGGLAPRASLGFGLGVLLRALSHFDLMEGVQEGLAETVEVLQEGVASMGAAANETNNPARRLARRLYGKLPLIYSAEGLGAAVARRWCAQINENGKALAYCNVLPELNHNEIVGWEVPTRVRAESFVIALRDRADHPRVQRRFTLTKSVLGARVPQWENVESVGNSPIARAMSLVLFGDYLSVYLAQAGGIEATPVSAIDLLKQKLSEPQT